MRNTLIAGNTGANGNCQAAETDARWQSPVPGRGVRGARRHEAADRFAARERGLRAAAGSEAIDLGTGRVPQRVPPRISSVAHGRSTETATASPVAIPGRWSTTDGPESPTSRSTARPARPVTLTFDNVTTAGTTTLRTSSAGPAPPAGTGRACPPVTRSCRPRRSSPAGACVHRLRRADVPRRGRAAPVPALRGYLADETVSVDSATNVICGRTTTLGVFAVFAPNRPPVASVTEPAGGYAVTEGGR